jgi:hypothetical protein
MFQRNMLILLFLAIFSLVEFGLVEQVIVYVCIVIFIQVVLFVSITDLLNINVLFVTSSQ